MTTHFILVEKESGAEHMFDNAHEAAVFLWGKDLRHYAIFVRQPQPPVCEVGELERRLKALL